MPFHPQPAQNAKKIQALLHSIQYMAAYAQPILFM